MQVLHTHWLLPRSSGDEAGLFIWAETAIAPQPKRDRRKKAAQLHPFLQARSDLEKLLRVTTHWNQRTARGQSLTLWLPTNKFGPVPSPDLLHDWEEDSDAPELRQWIVEGLWLQPFEAFHLLTALNNRPIRGIHLGSGSRYWQQAINLVLEILAQQKLRPTMVEIRDGRDLRYEARWQPILDSE